MAGRCRQKLDRRLCERFDAKGGGELPLSIKARCRCRRRAGFATGITSDWLPSSHVWSAAAARRTHIICDSPSLKALGRKVSDEFIVPLCRGHHREVHRCGDEAAWWKKAGIDPTLPARALWLESHPLPTASGDDQSRIKPDRRIKRGPTDKTKPIFEVGLP